MMFVAFAKYLNLISIVLMVIIIQVDTPTELRAQREISYGGNRGLAIVFFF